MYNSAYCCGVLSVPKFLWKQEAVKVHSASKVAVLVWEAGSFPKEGAFAVGTASSVLPP